MFVCYETLLKYGSTNLFSLRFLKIYFQRGVLCIAHIWLHIST